MKTGAEVQAHIVLKAAEDVEFRARLVKDPKGVIETETGLELPDDMLVFVNQAIANGLEPSQPIDTPLTEDELMQVMGGSGAPSEDIECDWYECNYK